MTTIPVQSTETLVLPRRGSQPRQYVHIQNDSDSDIFLKYDSDSQSVTVNSGIRLRPGQTLMLEETMPTNNPLYSDAIYAIHGATGSKTLRIQEGF
jgi:hypothetical protein